ncbi:unnamed protein product [Polarella glacialis]|uniref:Uncharacterized protein n=1 Tax=Polarella glacialis TaxID=89957 RepID=A0A813HT96_POLGL|nr:unnamed protein product [Polarella glacialis]
MVGTVAKPKTLKVKIFNGQDAVAPPVRPEQVKPEMGSRLSVSSVRAIYSRSRQSVSKAEESGGEVKTGWGLMKVMTNSARDINKQRNVIGAVVRVDTESSRNKLLGEFLQRQTGPSKAESPFHAAQFLKTMANDWAKAGASQKSRLAEEQLQEQVGCLQKSAASLYEVAVLQQEGVKLYETLAEMIQEYEELVVKMGFLEEFAQFVTPMTTHGLFGAVAAIRGGSGTQNDNSKEQIETGAEAEACAFQFAQMQPKNKADDEKDHEDEEEEEDEEEQEKGAGRKAKGTLIGQHTSEARLRYVEAYIKLHDLRHAIQVCWDEKVYKSKHFEAGINELNPEVRACCAWGHLMTEGLGTVPKFKWKTEAVCISCQRCTQETVLCNQSPAPPSGVGGQYAPAPVHLSPQTMAESYHTDATGHSKASLPAGQNFLDGLQEKDAERTFQGNSLKSQRKSIAPAARGLSAPAGKFQLEDLCTINAASNQSYLTGKSHWTCSVCVVGAEEPPIWMCYSCGLQSKRMDLHTALEAMVLDQYFFFRAAEEADRAIEMTDPDVRAEAEHRIRLRALQLADERFQAWRKPRRQMVSLELVELQLPNNHDNNNNNNNNNNYNNNNNNNDPVSASDSDLTRLPLLSGADHSVPKPFFGKDEQNNNKNNNNKNNNNNNNEPDEQLDLDNKAHTNLATNPTSRTESAERTELEQVEATGTTTEEQRQFSPGLVTQTLLPIGLMTQLLSSGRKMKATGGTEGDTIVTTEWDQKHRRRNSLAEEKETEMPLIKTVGSLSLALDWKRKIPMESQTQRVEKAEEQSEEKADGRTEEIVVKAKPRIWEMELPRPVSRTTLENVVGGRHPLPPRSATVEEPRFRRKVVVARQRQALATAEARMIALRLSASPAFPEEPLQEGARDGDELDRLSSPPKKKLESKVFVAIKRGIDSSTALAAELLAQSDQSCSTNGNLKTESTTLIPITEEAADSEFFPGLSATPRWQAPSPLGRLPTPGGLRPSGGDHWSRFRSAQAAGQFRISSRDREAYKSRDIAELHSLEFVGPESPWSRSTEPLPTNGKAASKPAGKPATVQQWLEKYKLHEAIQGKAAVKNTSEDEEPEKEVQAPVEVCVGQTSPVEGHVFPEASTRKPPKTRAVDK